MAFCGGCVVPFAILPVRKSICGPPYGTSCPFSPFFPAFKIRVKFLNLSLPLDGSLSFSDLILTAPFPFVPCCRSRVVQAVLLIFSPCRSSGIFCPVFLGAPLSFAVQSFDFFLPA